jgi:hypothetical protein
MSSHKGALPILAIAIIGAAHVTTLAGDSFAASADVQWIVGVWEGSATSRFVIRDARRCEFADEGSAITMKCSGGGEYRTAAGAPGGRRLAIDKFEFATSGHVTKISDSAVDIVGKVDAHTDTSRVGRAVRCSFKRSGDAGDALEGFCIISNVSTSISLKKTK